MNRCGFTEYDGIHAARYPHVPGSDVVDLIVGFAEGAARMSPAIVTSERLDAFFAVDGDGTVGITVDVLVDSKIPLGIPAVGTDNDAAWRSKLPRRDIDTTPTLILDALESKRTFVVDIPEVASETGSGRVMSAISIDLDTNVNR